MKTQRNLRELHVGKSALEKEAYNKFLREETFLDKTVEEDVDPTKTDASTFQEAEKLPETPPAVRKKSIWLKLKDADFLNNPWFVTIVGGILVSIVLLYIVQISVSQGVLSNNMASLQKDMDASKNNDTALTNKFHDLELKLSVAVEGTQKDIQYIKDMLKIQ